MTQQQPVVLTSGGPGLMRSLRGHAPEALRARQHEAPPAVRRPLTVEGGKGHGLGGGLERRRALCSRGATSPLPAFAGYSRKWESQLRALLPAIPCRSKVVEAAGPDIWCRRGRFNERGAANHPAVVQLQELFDSTIEGTLAMIDAASSRPSGSRRSPTRTAWRSSAASR